MGRKTDMCPPRNAKSQRTRRRNLAALKHRTIIGIGIGQAFKASISSPGTEWILVPYSSFGSIPLTGPFELPVLLDYGILTMTEASILN
ncbi:hypothetical protein KY284_001113 [Solanum tuberosum]|nr:hypothetical protein KY284_001113 [Solanum tuberosum]